MGAENMDINKVWTEFKGMIERQDAEIAKFGSPLQETLNTITKLNERIDELETKANRSPVADSKQEAGSNELAVKSFLEYARKGEKGMSLESIKSLATDSDPDGGYLMPMNMVNTVINKLIQFSPIRELATTITISQGDTVEIPAEDSTDFSGGWVAERGSRAQTQSGKLRMEKITAHEMYANPFVTQKLLDDAAFGFEAWLNDRVAKRFAVIEGLAFVSGSGNNQPEGILTKSGVTEVNSGNANLLTADGVISLFYALPEFYAKNATWLMKRSSVSAIRKLKDGQGSYLWQPGMAGDAPATILGRPYREAVDMPEVGAGNYPIVFGDIAAAYTIVDRQGVRTLRDPFTNKPFVEFYTTKRTGGQVVLAEAIVKQKVSA